MTSVKVPLQIVGCIFILLALFGCSTKAYLNRWFAYVNKGELDRAIADYDRAIQLRPDDAEAYYNRGTAYVNKGELDRAIADCDRAIQLQPGYTEVYINRGLAYANKGELDRAIADYDRAIQLQPGYAKVYINRGLAYANKGELDRAIADCDGAIQLQPDSLGPTSTVDFSTGRWVQRRKRSQILKRSWNIATILDWFGAQKRS